MSLELVTLNETEKKIFFQIICYMLQIIKCVDFTLQFPKSRYSNLKIVKVLFQFILMKLSINIFLFSVSQEAIIRSQLLSTNQQQ